MLYVDVSATGLYQNDEFTQNYSHMISFTLFTVNGVQNIRRFDKGLWPKRQHRA